MGANVPIPILIGSGPKKTNDDASIDIAELSVLTILKCLNDEIKKHFEPGLDIQIRMEDLTGLWLESENTEGAMIRYMTDFQKLLNILGYEGISIFKESELTTKKQFFIKADTYSNIFEQYLLDTNESEEKDYASHASFIAVKELGWTGIVPLEMRQYLFNKYEKLIPGITKEASIEIVARYLGATLARIHTKSAGKQSELYKSGFSPMEIAFARPTPGIPDNIQQARVYYRTVTMKNTKKNMPFWRAKGVLKIDRNGRVRYSLIGWSQEESESVIPGWYILSKDKETVKVSAGVIMED